MSRVRVACFSGTCLLLLVLFGLPGILLADEPNQAGLVIDFGEGKAEILCAAFEEDEISGVDLLLSSGLELVIDTSRMGSTICQIEQVGCPFPAKPCFCQCMGGGECAYWNYFYRDPGQGEWTYSALGAVMRKVKPGSVEAWVWGDGTNPPAEDLSFEGICQPPSPTPTLAPTRLPATSVPPTAVQTETPVAVQTPVGSPPEVPTETPTRAPTQPPPPTLAESAPLPSPTAAPAAATEPSLVSYWPFGLALLALLAVGLIARLRGS